MSYAVGLPPKHQSFRPSKFELAAMEFYKILWNFIFILWWDRLLDTKWLWHFIKPFIQQRLTLEDECNVYQIFFDHKAAFFSCVSYES